MNEEYTVVLDYNSLIYIRNEKFQKELNACLGSICNFENLLTESSILGKTINFCSLNESRNYWILGFTDGTFIYRKYDYPALAPFINGQCTASKSWETTLFIKPTDVLNTFYDSSTRKTTLKLTPFGEWLRDNTSADIEKFFKFVLEDVERLIEVQQEMQKEQDLRKYYELKEKLGL